MAEELQQREPTQSLKALMQQANIPSYRALAAQAGVSRWQVKQLRSGNISQMRLAVLTQLTAALKVSLSTLLSKFSPKIDLEIDPVQPESSAQSQQLADLQREYQRLQLKMAQQVELARSQTQTDALQTLETWLVQWPTIAKRIQERELPAAKLLPFIRPVEQLMAEWGVEAIAPVDATVPYDPRQHQLIGGIAEPGALVRVTHSGHRHQGKLLHRAKVKLENLA